MRCMSFIVALALSGCTFAAQGVRNNLAALYGKSESAVIAQLGPPHRQSAGVDEWDYAAQPNSGSLPIGAMLESLVATPIALTGLSITSGVAHSCRLIVTIDGGIVTHARIAGDHAGFTGDGAWCEAIFTTELAAPGSK